MAWYGYILLVLVVSPFARAGYFGDVHEDFRGLCVAAMLPASSESGLQLDLFREWWNHFLNSAGNKLFPNVKQEHYLSKANGHCANTTKPENDPICAYLKFVNIGNFMEQDLKTLERTIHDSGKPPSFYYQAYCWSWLEHPMMYRLECGTDRIPLWEYMAELSTAVENNNTNLLTHMKNVFSSSKAVELRREIDTTDCNKVASNGFCELKYFTEIADKTERLIQAYNGTMWNQTKVVYKNAIQMHFYGLKLKAPLVTRSNFLSTTEKEVKTWMRDILYDLVDYVNSSSIDAIIYVTDLLPPSSYLPCNTLAAFPSFSKMLCTFSGVIYPMKPYAHGLAVSKKRKRKLISTGIEYTEYLELKLFKQVLGMMETTHYSVVQVGNQMKDQIVNSTNDIKEYFQSIQSFELKIANADAESISGDLQKYLDKSTALAGEVDKHLETIIAGAWTAVLGDVAETTYLVGLAIISACNPAKEIIGGGSAADIITTTQDMMQAIARVAELGALHAALRRLIDESQQFINKIKKSEKQLKPVKSLIAGLNESADTQEFERAKDEFIVLYANYAPAVDPDDVAGLSAFWTVVIAEACRILDATSGSISGVAKAVVGGKWSCPRADIAVNKLITVYEELVEYQTSMMDSLLNYIRAAASYNAANDINKDYTSKTPDGMDLELLAAFSMSAYKVATYAAMDSYCNILHYREGREPAECKLGTRTFTKLLTREVPIKNKCHYMDLPVIIPTKPADINDSAFIDLSTLYAGKWVDFQVPDADWMVRHHWIPDYLKNSIFVVRLFELYLPTVSEWQKTITVRATATTGNKLHPPDGTEYVMEPTVTLPPFTYKEGKHGLGCSQTLIENAYKDKCRDLPDVCPETSTKDIVLFPNNVFPSIYARWHVKIEGYPANKLNVPASEIFLRGYLEVCRLDVSSSTASRRSTRSTTTKCCSDGQYFKESVRKCTPCPPGSERKYDGLLCGNVTRLMINTSGEDPFFTFEEAKAMCVQSGSNITTSDEMTRAVKLGYTECACGWISNNTVVAPYRKENCTENVGAKSDCTGRDKWPVYCKTYF